MSGLNKYWQRNGDIVLGNIDAIWVKYKDSSVGTIFHTNMDRNITNI